jgi:hypothetical protein
LFVQPFGFPQAIGEIYDKDAILCDSTNERDEFDLCIQINGGESQVDEAFVCDHQRRLDCSSNKEYPICFDTQTTS